MKTAQLYASKPMSMARFVRKFERTQLNNPYEPTLVTDDEDLICNKCVAEHFSEISHAHRTRSDNGWRPKYVVYIVPDDAQVCAVCYRSLGFDYWNDPDHELPDDSQDVDILVSRYDRETQTEVQEIVTGIFWHDGDLWRDASGNIMRGDTVIGWKEHSKETEA